MFFYEKKQMMMNIFNRKKTIFNIDPESISFKPPCLIKRKCRIVNLIDADTIDIIVKIRSNDIKCYTESPFSYITKMRVRLINFDSAEMTTYEGKIAKFIMSLYIESIPEGKIFIDTNSIDKFGRTLGNLYIIGKNNKEIPLYTMLLNPISYIDRELREVESIIGVTYDGGTKNICDSLFPKEKKNLDLPIEVKERLKKMYPVNKLYKSLLLGVPYRI